jgi:ribosomal protein S27AE
MSERSGLDLFRDRLLIVATKHRKEQVIAPILETELRVRSVVPDEFDTDLLGTFTRDVPRPGNQQETARIKAKKALDMLGETLAVASEGYFGPHPALPYLPCNRELVVLVDTQHHLEVVGEAISTETNFSHTVVEQVAEAEAFAGKVGFPGHGLVVMGVEPGTNQPDPSLLFKGITDPDQLQDAVRQVLARSPSGKAHIETDMRAMQNPTRMKVIEQATRDLLAKLKRTCPQCGMPGFAVSDRKPGLPCGLCRLPTSLTLAVISTCQKCHYSEESLYPDGVQVADPGQCGYCNP